ncbi:hypothetical protein GGR50DRAFT_688958 [Xylaria sp. CBS 124048]|nr:hypothetical protein GGR50DRAFT_688958 [Xylaria sp. CBS 124048]
MTEKASCKVIIVGGSVAGLSLANMLERAGIDFVVLEAHGDIAPQVGASIAIYPHFARILDQIGCCETVNHAIYRNPKGEAIFYFRGLADGLERRHGYPVIFIERQKLLKALYENLGQKEKVFVNKRFSHLEAQEKGIRAFMRDGSSYDGDILIGADGMHSAVRKAMHKLGKSMSPGSFAADEYAEVPCSYKCIFGMSHPTAGIKQGTNHIILGKGQSYLILTGSDRIYWFLNVKNPDVLYGKDIPRYSAEDERRLAEEHFGDQLNEYDTFEDLYKKKIMATLTPLHEYQWKRWYFQRIMTIGDACHKLHPISGNGGAAAVEDAATLLNVLQQKLDQAQGRLSTEDFQDVFAETQRRQENRTGHLLVHATKMQSFDAMESALAPLFEKFLIPNLTDDAALAIVGANTTKGRRIESLPIPQRPRYVPYEDELPAKPLRGMWGIVRVCLILWYLVYCVYSIAPQVLDYSPFVVKYFHAIVRSYPFATMRFRNGQTNNFASWISLFPLVIMWNLDAYRRGNVKSIGSWPVPMLFSAAFLVAGEAQVIPLYFLLAAFNSGRNNYTSVAGRPLPVSAVRSALLATCIVYLFSMILIGMRPFYPTAEEAFTALNIWRWPPLCIAVSTRILMAMNKSLDENTDFGPKTYLAVYLNKDYKPLTSLYQTLFALGVLTNILIPAPVGTQRMLASIVVPYCLHSAFEMRRLGYTTTREVLAAMLSILVAASVAGPGALLVATWYWRENVIHRLNK